MHSRVSASAPVTSVLNVAPVFSGVRASTGRRAAEKTSSTWNSNAYTTANHVTGPNGRAFAGSPSNRAVTQSAIVANDTPRSIHHLPRCPRADRASATTWSISR
jgi:hypothetical protein